MLKIPLSEVNFSFARSSGPGGQNVNKVETKVTASWNFEESAALTERQKQGLREKAEFLAKLDQDGSLVVRDQTTRSQDANKKNCITRLEELVINAVKPIKLRHKTKVPRKVKEERIKAKKVRATKLQNRKWNSSE
jgi:ribosome-associated protein